jgi:hypothetical protein
VSWEEESSSTSPSTRFATAATWPRSAQPKQRQSMHRRQKGVQYQLGHQASASSGDITTSSTSPPQAFLALQLLRAREQLWRAWEQHQTEPLLCRQWDISRIVDLVTLNKTIISEERRKKRLQRLLVAVSLNYLIFLSVF